MVNEEDTATVITEAVMTIVTSRAVVMVRDTIRLIATITGINPCILKTAKGTILVIISDVITVTMTIHNVQNHPTTVIGRKSPDEISTQDPGIVTIPVDIANEQTILLLNAKLASIAFALDTSVANAVHQNAQI